MERRMMTWSAPITSPGASPARLLRWAGAAPAAALVGIGVLLATPGLAQAATENVTNGSFQQPGTEGATPTGWTPTDFGAETSPFNASIGTYDSAGTYPPPAGEPGGNVAGNFAVEDFYQAGSSTGVEGFGGDQVLAAPVPSAADPQVSWATAQTRYPATTLAAWAGSLLEVDFTAGSTSYHLDYVNPFIPGTSSYAASPASSDTATTKYLVLAALTSNQWYVQPARDVAADVLAQFGIASFTVTQVDFGNIEDTTSSAYPYPNMASYWKNVSLSTGGPLPVLGESPLALGIPLAGAAAGGAWLWRRRARTA